MAELLEEGQGSPAAAGPWCEQEIHLHTLEQEAHLYTLHFLSSFQGPSLSSRAIPTDSDASELHTPRSALAAPPLSTVTDAQGDLICSLSRLLGAEGFLTTLPLAPATLICIFCKSKSLVGNF